VGAPVRLNVVHQDADVLVVDKPTGLLTAGQMGETRDTLFKMVKEMMRNKMGRKLKMVRKKAREEGAPRFAGQGAYLIHRLDKEASGLVVFALSEKGFTWLKEDFKSKRVHRIYTALVEGEVGEPGTSGTIQSFLREDDEGRIGSLPSDAFRGGENQQTAKLAVTHYKVVATGKGMSLLSVRLETGRKNQIRVHLAEKGFPLVGDRRFGAKTDPGKRVCLHASELGFTHPTTGQTVRFVSPAPAPFYKAVGAKPPAVTLTPPPIAPPAASTTGGGGAGGGTSWEAVAGWYDELMDEKTNDHYEQVVIPGVTRLVSPSPGVRVLDVACGQGVGARRLAALGARVVGVDAAPGLIEAARRRGEGEEGGAMRFEVGDARDLGAALGAMGEAGGFDVAVCVMGLTNIDPLSSVFAGVAGALKAGGRFVAVIQHPAFRAAEQTAWGWDAKVGKQYRRVDGYLSHGERAIVMNPGGVAKGEAPVTTVTFHRPIQTYARLLSEAGLLIEAVEEWPGRRVSTSGPRAAEENRSRAEIPLFLAFRAVKAAGV
jgi:23S rRNA pseudouridine1911/1915/1917 synthase